jgi:hypothetical protein
MGGTMRRSGSVLGNARRRDRSKARTHRLRLVRPVLVPVILAALVLALVAGAANAAPYERTVSDRKAAQSLWVSKNAQKIYTAWVTAVDRFGKMVDNACQAQSTTAAAWCTNEQDYLATGDGAALASLEAQATVAYNGWDSSKGTAECANVWKKYISDCLSRSKYLRLAKDRRALHFVCGALKTYVDRLQDGEVDEIGWALLYLTYGDWPTAQTHLGKAAAAREKYLRYVQAAVKGLKRLETRSAN